MIATIHNADIASAFDEIADSLELTDANPFRVRAYRNAARLLGELRLDVAQMVARGETLPKLPGIGEDLSGKIVEIARTGTCELLQRMRKGQPAGVTQLLHVRGLGPKRVRALYQNLGVQTPEQLLRAVRDGRVRGLPGFGEKTEQQLLGALEQETTKVRRHKLVTAAQYAEPLAQYLRQVPGVADVVIAGSYRRMRETVGDIDILVTADSSIGSIERFCAYPEVHEVLAQGPTKASVVLRSGLQADLRVVDKASYGSALVYFTGSKAHNIAIRKLGQDLGLKINEYGVYRGDRRVAGETEESVYAAIGLPWIAPELREDAGEIEAARAGRLPKLIELSDLRGDLHCHTKASDGHHSLREMAEAAVARGLQYLAITEHSRRLTVAHGLDPRRLAKQGDEIARLASTQPGIRILKGVEVDILEDGSLDLPDTSLAELDIVVAAVHSKFELSRARQTERILAAMDSPYVRVLAHPSGRLIDRRDPYDVDMLAITRKAKARDIALELNAHPERLDLLDTHCRMAKEEGALIAVSSDAHSVQDFENLAYAIGQARRGWLEKADVVNTRPLAEFLRWLARDAAGTRPRKAA